MLLARADEVIENDQSHSTPSPSSVPRWLTICLQWLLFQQIHYHGSESRIMPLRGIKGIRFLLLPTAIVRPLSSLAKFSFVISNIRFPPGSGRRGRTPALTCQPTTRVSAAGTAGRAHLPSAKLRHHHFSRTPRRRQA